MKSARRSLNRGQLQAVVSRRVYTARRGHCFDGSLDPRSPLASAWRKETSLREHAGASDQLRGIGIKPGAERNAREKASPVSGTIRGEREANAEMVIVASCHPTVPCQIGTRLAVNLAAPRVRHLGFAWRASAQMNPSPELSGWQPH